MSDVLKLAEDRLVMLLRSTLEDSDHPTATQYVIDRLKGPTHRHYKGGLYTVLCDDATAEWTNSTKMVVYRSCQDGRVWVRAKENFEETVITQEFPQGVLRFTPVGGDPT